MGDQTGRPAKREKEPGKMEEGENGQVLFLLAERAASEGPRWTRAVKGTLVTLLGKEWGEYGKESYT